MKASIIIPTLNRADQLCRTMKSLVESDFDQSQYEIIVIDNGSEDNTRQIVEKFIKEYPKHIIRYFYDDVPGLLTGRHRGAKEANSETLVFVDDDIHADKSWLSAIVETFERYPNVHLVGGKCLPLYESTPPSWINYFWNDLPQGGRMLCELSLCDYGNKGKIIDPTWVFGLNFSIRKKTLYDLGGFHPDCVPIEYKKFQGDGETGLSLKMARKGYKAFYNPKALVYHEVPSSRMTLEYFDKRYFYQGICDSFTEVRYNHGFKNESVTIEKIKKLLNLLYSIVRKRISPSRSEKEMLQNRFESMRGAGYSFHQEMARKSPTVLSWVIKENYFDYNLPEGIGRIKNYN